jgi:hypothetical protein
MRDKVHAGRARGKDGADRRHARYWGTILQGRTMVTGRMQPAATTRVVLRVVLYYLLLVGGATLAWPWLPRTGGLPAISLEAMLGAQSAISRERLAAPEGLSLAGGVAVAMLSSVLLALPVAWIYLVTRAKQGYRQSVVQLLVILPAVVAGVVLLVKYSLALAFSLAGIVAAVRFRNTLDDSKDAVYVFLATAIGLAAAVNVPVAAVLSAGFNAIVLILFYTDFGSAPVELDGRIAERRLRRARALARTGTFVARMDEEVFQNMTREQLEGVAERAWHRARGDGAAAPARDETRLRVHTHDLDALRQAIEPRLATYAKSWRAGDPASAGGAHAVDYFVTLRKTSRPDELVDLVRAAGARDVISVELL